MLYRINETCNKKNFLNQTRICNKCNNQYNISIRSSNFLLCIDISNQIKMLLQNKDILLKLLANLELIDKNTKSESSTIRDIYNGELYNKIYDIKSTEYKILTIKVRRNFDLNNVFGLSIY